MSIGVLERRLCSSAAVLFNELAEGETVYKKLSEQAFEELFFGEDPTCHKIQLGTFDEEKEEKLTGFAFGTLVKGKEIGYVTFVAVDPDRRHEGIGAKLLKAMEEALVQLGKQDGMSLTKIQMIFFNPVNLTWIIPGTEGHDHPNAPGVDTSSGAYEFFKQQGYQDRVFQNSFYLPLNEYVFPDSMQERLETLKEKGLAIGYFDPAVNFDLEGLTEDLGSEGWKKELLGNAAREDGGDPLIIAIDAGEEHKDKIDTSRLGTCPGRVIGFTGPIHVQESGRGYFAGIGVHSAYRKHGLGTALFHSLCRGQKENGAAFMTLFTGTENPAANIYQGAGFRIVHNWSDMEKVVEK